MRYRSGDRGKTLDRTAINEVLKSLGYATISATGSPILAHFGRGLSAGGIYPEEVKEIIYSHDEIASLVTGNFLLENNSDSTKLDIQLKEGIRPGPAIENLLGIAFRGLVVHIRVHEYELYPYPLNFERKVRYINESDYCRDRRAKAAELLVEV